MRQAVLLVAALLAASPVQAQQCNANPGPCSVSAQTIAITIGRALQLNIAPSTTSLAVPTPAHYNAGFVSTTGPTATVRSNMPWSLSISASTQYWNATNTQSQAAWTTKPASDLEWANSAGGSFTPVTTSAASVQGGNATAGADITLFYRTRYNWTKDTPGNYSLQLVLTVTSP